MVSVWHIVFPVFVFHAQTFAAVTLFLNLQTLKVKNKCTEFSAATLSALRCGWMTGPVSVIQIGGPHTLVSMWGDSLQFSMWDRTLCWLWYLTDTPKHTQGTKRHTQIQSPRVSTKFIKAHWEYRRHRLLSKCYYNMRERHMSTSVSSCCGLLQPVSIKTLLFSCCEFKSSTKVF